MNNENLKNNFIRKYLWIILMAIGIIGFLSIILLMPLKQSINQEWQFFYKILIYVIICFAIGFFPNNSKNMYILIFTTFLLILGFIIPKIAYTGVILFPKEGLKPFDQYYTLIYFILYPFITLTAGFAYRLGGGSTGNTFKIAFGGQIFLLSGYLDLMWLIINKAQIPDVMTHAYHIKIIIGHFPTFNETIIFALCHIPLFIILLALPLDKWINRFFVKEGPCNYLSKL